MPGQRQAMDAEPWVALGRDMSPVGSLNGGDQFWGVACEREPGSEVREGPVALCY